MTYWGAIRWVWFLPLLFWTVNESVSKYLQSLSGLLWINWQCGNWQLLRDRFSCLFRIRSCAGGPDNGTHEPYQLHSKRVSQSPQILLYYWLAAWMEMPAQILRAAENFCQPMLDLRIYFHKSAGKPVLLWSQCVWKEMIVLLYTSANDRERFELIIKSLE